jgi:multidrug resistance protein, MATE family
MTAASSTHVSLRDVYAIALPIMLSGATVPLVGFVDMLVVGQLGSAALIGGMSVSTTMFNAIYWAFGFLRMGTTGFTAQAVGAGDHREQLAVLARGLLLAGLIGVLLLVLQWPIRALFFAAIGGSLEVQSAATTYYDWRIWAAPAGLINYVLFGWFMGRGRAMVAFWLQLALNLANIVVSLVLVIRLDWGVAGAGAAACVSEVGAAVAGLLVARRMVTVESQTLAWASVADVTALRRMVAVNRDIFIRTACLLGVTIAFTSQGAKPLAHQRLSARWLRGGRANAGWPGGRCAQSVASAQCGSHDDARGSGHRCCARWHPLDRRSIPRRCHEFRARCQS